MAVRVLTVNGALVFVAVPERDVGWASGAAEGGESVTTSTRLGASAAALGASLPWSPCSHYAVGGARVLGATSGSGLVRERAGLATVKWSCVDGIGAVSLVVGATSSIALAPCAFVKIAVNRAKVVVAVAVIGEVRTLHFEVAVVPTLDDVTNTVLCAFATSLRASGPCGPCANLAVLGTGRGAAGLGLCLGGAYLVFKGELSVGGAGFASDAVFGFRSLCDLASTRVGTAATCGVA